MSIWSQAANDKDLGMRRAQGLLVHRGYAHAQECGMTKKHYFLAVDSMAATLQACNDNKLTSDQVTAVRAHAYNVFGHMTQGYTVTKDGM